MVILVININLKRVFFGLKQFARQWYTKFLNFVIKLGSESCIFVRHVNEQKIFLALYVDHLLIADSDARKINVIIHMLYKEFQMSKSAKASEFLDIRMKFIYFEWVVLTKQPPDFRVADLPSTKTATRGPKI